MRYRLITIALTLAAAVSVVAASKDQAPRAGAQQLAAVETMPPVGKDSVKFLVLGDTGTGDRGQYDTAAQVWKSHEVFPYEFAIMMGDNIYGSERP